MKKQLFISWLVAVLIAVYTLQVFGEDHIGIGKTALEKGDLGAAIKSFKEAIKKDKKNSQGYFWLGASYLKADSLDQAERTLIQARELDPQDPKIYELLGDIYCKQNILVAAIDQYRKVIELEKKNTTVLLKIAELSRKSRQYNEAVEAYINVLLIDSTNFTALSELATIYLRAKQYQNALPLYRDLVLLQPDSLSYQIDYVKILNETKYYKDLIPYAENIIQKDSTQVDIFDILRNAYVETKDYANAEKLFSMSNIDSLSNDELIKRGKALKALEKYDDAISSYELAYRRDSTLSEIYYDLATIYNKKERYADAVYMFNKKIESDTSAGYRWASYFQAAQSLSNMKDYKKAKEYILKSFDYKPDYINAWEMLAQYNGMLELTNEQSAAYRKVIELIVKADTNGNGGATGKYKNSLNAAYLSLGSQLMHEKKYPEAIEYFKKALQITPKDCALLLAVGSLYQRTKNEDESRKYYCKVIQICPKSEHAKSATSALKSLGFDCE
ncbi:MAG: tetratricopeptide repeat protein [Bacteroidota bacterium]|nr:tetratricopeptide repeat protein [Bacteroidota bacterium]